MPDMTFEEVAGLARAAGLVLSQEDLVEVTHRLNTVIADVEGFSHPDLDNIAPVPFRSLEETDDGQ